MKVRIVETAMDAFARQGIRAVKMDDIAHALGISKRTLYEIYETKEAVLFEGVRIYADEHVKRMSEVVAQSNHVMDVILAAYRNKIEEFGRVSPDFYTDLERYPRILKYIQKDSHKRDTLFYEFMQRGVKEGYFRSDVNYEFIPHLFSALGRYMMENRLYKQFPVEVVFRNFTLISLRGICTQKGIDFLDTYLNG